MKLILSLLVVLLLSVSAAVATFLLPDQQTLKFTGLVQAKEIKSASRFGGRVKEILVHEGDTVTQGQKLILFDDFELKSRIADAQAALKQAELKHSLLAQGVDPADLQQAEAQVNTAQQNLRMLSDGARAQELTQAKAKVTEAEAKLKLTQTGYENADRLLAEGVISEQKRAELKTQYHVAQSALSAAKAQYNLVKSGNRSEQINIAKADFKAAQAQYSKLKRGPKAAELQIASTTIEQARNALKLLQAQLDEMVIEAPVSGVVSVLNLNTGELIQPGKPVVSIIDSNHLWTDIYIPESSLSAVRPGQSVEIKPPVYPGKLFLGRIAFVSPKSQFVPNSTAGNPSEESAFRIKVEVNQQDQSHLVQLYPGMKITVEFKKPD